MFYTVAAEFELQYAAIRSASELQVFRSEEDAVKYVETIRGLYKDHINVYKLVPVSTYAGRDKE